MPKGEFQNRDRDEVPGLGNIPLAGSLGELPTDLAEERGDLAAYSISGQGSQHPDMQRAGNNMRAERITGLGSPALDYTVRSIYDSRPTSANDFNLWFEGEDTETPYDISIFERCFKVPLGYVAVLREVKFLVAPVLSITGNFDGTARILIDGTVRDPIDVVEATFVSPIAIPWRDGGTIETFLIADEGQFIGATVALVDQTFDQDNRILQVGFYGNFLLKTGRPAMFEPANLAGRAKSAITSSVKDIGPSGADLMVKRRRRKPFANVPILRK